MRPRPLLAIRSALLIGAAWLIPSAWSQDEAVKQSQGISFVSGGVGEDSRARLDAMRDFNLKLLFALSSGAYISDVHVRIEDPKGNVLVETNSDGPIFLAKIPPGRYRVSAVFEGKRGDRKIEVPMGKRSVLHFRWSGEG